MWNYKAKYELKKLNYKLLHWIFSATKITFSPVDIETRHRVKLNRTIETNIEATTNKTQTASTILQPIIKTKNKMKVAPE